MKIQRAVALKISKLLLEKNMTQYALAKKMLVPQTTISHIMHEDYKSINFETLIKIADAFDMTIQEFLSDKLFQRDKLDID